MARLITIADGKAGRVFELAEQATIGRNSTQTVQLLDRLCSKEHAVVRRAGSLFTLEDLGSRNGTFVNAKSVTSPLVLTDGDEITIGSTTLVFHATSGDSPVNPSQGRVTIGPDILKSAISASLSYTGEQDFRPANLIDDPSELRRSYEKLRVAYKLQKDIALEHDLGQLVNRILACLFESLECDRGAILLVNHDSDQLETRAVRSRDAFDTSEITISDTVIQQVVKGRKAIVSSDLLGDARFDQAQSVILQGIRSSMSVPLISRDKVVGVIYLDSLLTTNAFTQRDLELVESLSSQAALAIENSQLMRQREDELRLRDKFSRLLSPRIVEQILDKRVEFAKGGTARTSSVLFSDIRGFTPMSERMEAEAVVAMLNEYFELMVEIVFEFEGTLDKYMGDGLMALFGSPVDIQDAPVKALMAAVRMREALAEYNLFRKAEGKEEVRIGIGIETGPLVAGYMGSTRTMNYTVIGPTVNLAARLCGAAGSNEILITDSTLEAVREWVEVETREPKYFKGIGEPVVTHNVIRLKKRTETGREGDR